jgi:DNA-binding MarR family transcriptional regulator
MRGSDEEGAGTSAVHPRDGGALEEALDAVVRASRFFAAVTAEAIAQAGDGVTLPQLRVLVLASTVGVLNNTAVAEALDVHISNASRMCDRLVQAGLLARRDAPSDRRQVELSLTPKGTALVDAVFDHRREVFGRTLERLTPREHRALVRALTTFAELGEEQLDLRSTPLP